MRLTKLEGALLVLSVTSLLIIGTRTAASRRVIGLMEGAVTSYSQFATFSDPGLPTSSAPSAATSVLFLHLGHSLSRVAVGAILGATLAFVAGLLAFWRLEPFEPAELLFAITRGIPLMGLIPIFFLVFGSTEFLGGMAYIATALFLTLAPEVYGAARTLPLQIVKRARLSGLSTGKLLFVVVLPGVVDRLRTGFRSVVGLLWAFSIGGEMVANRNGLGYLLRRCYEFGRIEQLFILALLYSLLGFITIFLVDWLLHTALGPHRMRRQMEGESDSLERMVPS